MNVTSEIKSYIELKETCGALLLTGKWGCGKSYIMHQLADKRFAFSKRIHCLS